MNFLSLRDGQASLLKIADRLNVPMWELYELVDKLKNYSLIDEK